MRDIALIRIPYDSGHHNARMGNGPDALIARGFRDRLNSRCAVETVLLPAGFHSEAQALVALQHRATTATRDAINRGRLPILLSGNCGTAALSATAALGPETGVIWFDAHGDCNTPETSPSGFLDGMCLAILTGQCWPKLTPRLESFAPIPGANVIQIGVRHVDPEEKLLLESLKINRVASTQTDRLAPAIDSLRKRTKQFYVHLDADVLDRSEGAANSYACSGGLTRQQFTDSMQAIAATDMIGAIGVTSYDPATDTDNRIADILIEAATILVS